MHGVGALVGAPHARDGAILGYADDEMRTLRDRFGRAVPLPPDGVVLTDLLGELLRVKVGDTLEVQIREGKRPVERLTVSGFVDEGFGLQGHMRIGPLREVLHEEPLVTSGLLRVDPNRSGELDERLKDAPISRRSPNGTTSAQFREQRLGDCHHAVPSRCSQP
jgi:putative ABC transport system permease protein